MVLAMTMALLLAVASPAMAGCQAKGAATTQERTTKRGATNPSASSTDSPEVVTTLRAWGDNFDGQLGDGTVMTEEQVGSPVPVAVIGLL